MAEIIHARSSNGCRMQVLYVVEFALALKEPVPGDTGAVYACGLAAAAAWVFELAGEPFGTADLCVSGEKDLRSRAPGETKSARWETFDAGPSRTMRLEVVDKSSATGTNFITRVTIAAEPSAAAVRVSMAREVPIAWLSPAAPADLRQPGIVRKWLVDEQIIVSVRAQAQDGRYLQVRTDGEVEELSNALDSETRLPIVLMHTRTLPAVETARIAASKLVGLVRVVTLNLHASRLLEQRSPGLAPPYAGARLVWSDKSAPTVDYSAKDINGGDADWLRAQVMRRVAPVSVLTRGRDQAYERAKQAHLAARHEAVEARLRAAAASGDQKAQVAALQEQVGNLQIEVVDWAQLTSSAEAETETFRAQAELVPALEQRVEQLQIALLAVQQGVVAEPTADPWETLPDLVKGNENSALNLFLQLGDLSDGRFACTDRAATSWKKAKYPYPEDVRGTGRSHAHGYGLVRRIGPDHAAPRRVDKG